MRLLLAHRVKSIRWAVFSLLKQYLQDEVSQRIRSETLFSEEAMHGELREEIYLLPMIRRKFERIGRKIMNCGRLRTEAAFS